MNDEARDPGADKLASLIGELEQILAQLDDLGLGKIALSVHEAIESARATREIARNESLRGSNAG